MPKKRSTRNTPRILKNTTNAFFTFDAKGRYTYLSPEALRLAGKPAAAFLGRRLTDVFPRRYKNLFYKKYREAVRTKRKTAFEAFYEKPHQWFTVTVYPAADGSATVYFTDITAHKEVERRMQHSEAHERAMVDHIKEYAIYLLDTTGKIQSWNAGAERTYGYHTAEVLGKPAHIFFADRKSAMGALAKELKTATTKRRSEQEGWRVRKNGTTFLANVITRTVHDEAGKLTGFLKVTRDITEQVRLQRALEDQTRDLEFAKDVVEREKANEDALMDSLGEGVAAIDANGIVTLINRQAQILLGVPEHHALGQHFTKVWHIEDDLGRKLPKEMYPIAVALRTGKKVENARYWYYGHPHNRFPAAVTASPIVSNQKIIGAVVVLRDIGKEKGIDRAKSEFVSLASHQLRTPLTAIKLFAEMLLREQLGALTPQQRAVINSLDSSNTKMINLVNALLNVSRIESGRLKPKPEHVDLPFLIEEVLGEARAVARLKRCIVKFSLQPNTNLPPVVTDPSLLRQVIMNLVNNSIAYSPDGRTVTVILRKRRDGYTIEIKDKGIGIPKISQPRIFERFYRATGAIKKKTDGTGLGLYMSKMITNLLGGKIWFTSIHGRGTTFFISIPLSIR